jgi:pentose-5-phosphate-3-epimerase
MIVNPGFGGQTFIERTLDKIVRMRRLLDGRGARAELEVDGGIKSSNVARVVAAGADVIVAGSAIFRPTRPYSRQLLSYAWLPRRSFGENASVTFSVVMKL